MRNSVSATDLSKMAFCEVNVIKKPKLTRLDRERIDKGNREHARFEQAIRQAGQGNSMIDEKSPRSTPVDQNRSKLFTIRTVTTLLLICAIGIYFFIGLQR